MHLQSPINTLISALDHLYIDEASKNSDVVSRLLSLFPSNKIRWVTSENQLPRNQEGALTAKDFDKSKRNLFITPFKGQFFKPCPGASQKQALVCCNYHVLNLGLQCNMNCSYCYLQSYLNTPMMTIYSNIENALEELHSLYKTQGHKALRVGTGEVIDSLSLDPLTHYSRSLIEFFSQTPNWKLELKTKSDHVDQFLDCVHGGNTIVSWSINPQNIIAHEEHNTASLEARLSAAERCAQKGFPIAFHFDPMIYHENWQYNYENLIKEITQRFDTSQINGITVGTLRFQPEQRHMMRERFGMKSLVMKAEMFPSESGKLRYDSKLRTEMFRFAVDSFKKYAPTWPVTICMETPETWISTYDKLPTQMDELKPFFKPSVRL